MTDHPGVLVVDDDPTIRSVLADLLQMEGYRVRVAGNGRQALEILDAWRPDVIVLDLMMPVMSGRAFREAQRALPDARRDIPVVVLSAAREARAQARALEAATAIPKPFDLDQVITAVERLTGRASAERPAG